MNIDTKFDVGQKVFHLDGVCIFETKVLSIKIYVNKKETRSTYTLEDGTESIAACLFATKQELLNSL